MLTPQPKEIICAIIAVVASANHLSHAIAKIANVVMTAIVKMPNKPETEIMGQRILFEVEDLGEFEGICQICDGKLFHSGDNRTVLYCVKCKTVFADNTIIPRPERPANTLIIDLKYDDSHIVSFPVICNCGYGGFVRASDGSSLCCGKCLMIIAKPTFVGAFRMPMDDVRWVV